MEQLLSEEKNRASERIDRVSTVELLQIINREDQTVADAVKQEIPRIAAAVDAIVERFRQCGRLFYIGAGTSGRLGVLDAAECPPTFGTPAERVQGLLAGGEAAIFRASEGSEDDPKAGQADLEARGFGPKDALVGITASGRTPYVLGAVAYARSLGALTVGLSCNPESQLSRNVDVAITPVVGPEVIAGSTRMKAASAQKTSAQYALDSGHGKDGLRSRELDGQAATQQQEAHRSRPANCGRGCRMRRRPCRASPGPS